MDLQTALSVASMAGAAISTVATVWFWFVRVRGERANLSCELSERELFLGAMTEQKRQIGLKLSLVVVNGSTLPNAVLGVKVRVRLREGAWAEAERVSFDRSTARPINLPALQTAQVVVSGYLTFAYASELEQGNKALAAYSDRYLTDPREIEVELKGLNDRRFACVVSYQSPS
jgi:hypothetical protein